MLACPSIRIRHLTSHAFANRKRVTPPRSQCCPVLRKTHRFDSENNLLLYERGFSFFSFHSADRPTPETFTTLNRTGNISLRLSLTTETSEEDFIVLVDEVETTIVGDECSDLLSVLDQLDSDTLSDGGVGLFGLNTNLLENYALGVGRSSEWR